MLFAGKIASGVFVFFVVLLGNIFCYISFFDAFKFANRHSADFLLFCNYEVQHNRNRRGTGRNDGGGMRGKGGAQGFVVGKK
jgi:hypothetical protein